MNFSKVIWNIIIGFFILFGLSSCTRDKYVEYRPHYLSSNNEHKHFGESELDSVEFENTIHVLKFYGEDFETKNGNVILITKELSKDWELVWNYTNKANDIEWLKTHITK